MNAFLPPPYLLLPLWGCSRNFLLENTASLPEFGEGLLSGGFGAITVMTQLFSGGMYQFFMALISNFFAVHVSNPVLWKLVWLLNNSIDYWQIIQISPIYADKDTEEEKKGSIVNCWTLNNCHWAKFIFSLKIRIVIVLKFATCSDCCFSCKKLLDLRCLVNYPLAFFMHCVS